MPLLIENKTATEVVTEFAEVRDILVGPLRERLAMLREAYPLTPATGAAADKTFFDALSGET